MTAAMPDPTPVDPIVDSGSIMTIDATPRIVRDGALAIKDDRIIAVSKRQEALGQYRARSRSRRQLRESQGSA